MRQIATIDELFTYGVNVLSEREEPQDVRLSDQFNFHVRLHGNSWTGDVDFRLAGFVVELQKKINYLCSLAYDQRITLSDVPLRFSDFLVKVEVGSGSLEAYAKIKDILQACLSNMESKHILVLGVMLIAAVLVSSGVDRYFVYKERELAANGQQEQARMVGSFILENTALIADMQRPKRALVNRMEEGDRIEFPEFNTSYSAEEARQVFKISRERVDSERAYIDDSFTVTAINFKTDVVELTSGNISFRATLENLNQNDIRILHDRIREARAEHRLPIVDLQVTAAVKRREITAAVVFGVGPRRQGAVALADVVD
jgi:hypothetical protein